MYCVSPMSVCAQSRPPVEAFTPELQHIVDDMFETMYAEEGIGLAATQVDIHQRIIVIDVSENREDQLVLINPEILEQSGSTGIEEGCLSVPGNPGLVPRRMGQGQGTGSPRQHLRAGSGRSARHLHTA